MYDLLAAYLWGPWRLLQKFMVGVAEERWTLEYSSANDVWHLIRAMFSSIWRRYLIFAIDLLRRLIKRLPVLNTYRMNQAECKILSACFATRIQNPLLISSSWGTTSFQLPPYIQGYLFKQHGKFRTAKKSLKAIICFRNFCFGQRLRTFVQKFWK